MKKILEYDKRFIRLKIPFEIRFFFHLIRKCKKGTDMQTAALYLKRAINYLFDLRRNVSVSIVFNCCSYANKECIKKM